tara:strand:- start:102 stop:218 length:117 start_codon:yes stop_codon:yes gene_type:complete
MIPNECKLVASAFESNAGGFAIKNPVITRTNMDSTFNQ